MGNPNVAAYNPSNGEELWSVEGMAGEVCPSPCSADGIIYAANEYAKLMAINGKDGSVVWEAADYLPEVSSPVVANGKIYIATSYGVLAVYNAKTGEQEKGNTYLFNMFYSNNGNIYNPGMFNGFNKDMAQKIFASTDGIMMQLKKPGNFILNDRSITHRKGLNEEQLKAMKDELFKQWAKEFVRNVEKKYGATQASLLRSQSKILTIKDIHKVNVLIKGLHIDVVKEILQVITEEDQAATYLSHHRTYDDGTSVYYLESVFNGTIARIWFKNNYITNWTIY
jgi:hypothetical protein